MLIRKGRWKRKMEDRFYAKQERLDDRRNMKMRTKDRRYKDSEWKNCERVDGKEGKININTHLKGWREDEGNVNEGTCKGIW